MKIYRRFFAVAAIAVVVFLSVISMLCGKAQKQKRDMIPINDIVQTVRENIDEPEIIKEIYPDIPIIVFAGNGERIYVSDKAPDNIRTVMDAGRAGYFCMAVTESERFLGNVAVPDPILEEYQQKQNGIFLASAISLTFIMLLLAAAGIFIRSRVVLPFRRMKQFAENIAQGELDDPLIMEKHNMFGSFTESFDIMREELRSARRREDEMKLREKELTASLSHDIKTPVTGIKLICELLMCKTDDPYIREKIDSINQKAERIHVLADDMLTSTLDELGEMRVNCHDERSAVLHRLVIDHDTRRLAIDEKVPDCLINTDVARLSQVIGNIISNSYKYAGTEIRIKYAFQDHYLAMEISDLGGGVDEDEIDLLTVKYYRGKNNTDGKDGSGLGLYISSELMKRMNGNLSCAQIKDGLSVTLLIPLS